MTPAAQSYRDLIAFIRLGRPYFLGAGLVMHALGVCAALYAGATLNWPALLLGQVAITATQWMVQYANEYFDLSGDRLNPAGTVWSGGSRVLPRGELAPCVAYRAAIVLAAISAVTGLALGVVTGDIVPPLFVGLTLFLSWGYSAPPFQWPFRGIGELITALIVAVLTPTLGFYLQAGDLVGWIGLVVWAPFCLLLCFQISVTCPDAHSDAAVGKRTLVVQDQRVATSVYRAALAGAYLALPLMLLARLPVLVVAAPLLLAPLAVWLWRRASQGALTNPAAWVANEWGNVVLLIGTALTEAAAFALSGF